MISSIRRLYSWLRHRAWRIPRAPRSLRWSLDRDGCGNFRGRPGTRYFKVTFGNRYGESAPTFPVAVVLGGDERDATVVLEVVNADRGAAPEYACVYASEDGASFGLVMRTPVSRAPGAVSNLRVTGLVLPFTETAYVGTFDSDVVPLRELLPMHPPGVHEALTRRLVYEPCPVCGRQLGNGPGSDATFGCSPRKAEKYGTPGFTRVHGACIGGEELPDDELAACALANCFEANEIPSALDLKTAQLGTTVRGFHLWSRALEILAERGGNERVADAVREARAAFDRDVFGDAS